MRDSPRFWLITRIALAILSVPAWLQIRSAMPDDFSNPPKWHFPLVMIGFSFFSVIALSILRSDQEWYYPNWSANPLDLARPVERMHIAASSFLAGSLGLLATAVTQQSADWAWVLPGTIGIGLLAGIYAAATRKPSAGT